MGTISGKEFIDRLDQLGNEIWFDGKKIEGKISEHPAFKGIIETKSSLYDLQKNPNFEDKMTFFLPGKEEPIGLSYLQPKTKADIKRRRIMIEHWARQTQGMMGRSPDYMNTVMMSFASSAAILVGKENCFPENILSVYEKAMEQDLSFTHTFITPQVNRSQTIFGIPKEPISARVIDRNEKGIVIKGARLLATQGGITDEVIVFSTPRVFFDTDEAYAFSIPSNTKGVKFICRESFVLGDSNFNYPLSSRYEEMDTIIVFDNVLVPWDRVFFYDNSDAATNFFTQSSFLAFAYHQAAIRQIVKTEFLLGIAQLLVESIDVSEYQHIQEKMSEIIIGIETMKALLDKSENDAELDEWGYMRPSETPLQVFSTIFPKIYPRFCEIIQLIGASGMVTLPTENTFHSEIRGDLDQYLQSVCNNAEDRVKLFRLGWDLTMSPFGTRQTQYERYFFGDPIRLASGLYNLYPKAQLVERVKSFLDINKEE
ncbi:4-hydroxyphenylacetate 3-monooxygenase, oxygenase component [Bacillus sp. FJAT-49736]|uniref:4-hydroxyphenylacetate 3-monooxygenase, oxygenase component n=1 Tax=Bacillus sp. FJAT-49736 TaxID=2833582 RepID=UPI001BC9014F|nr:4-hydroxyphenylacetate 3-monooxygenase, oxygenase component [Bacillus sp. FJAT-49736]MBS4174774.1 4-hydroxyphenylacetate 3-monooxygenase, oxygenase component [Bacillus sp. FJAT-49736]